MFQTDIAIYLPLFDSRLEKIKNSSIDISFFNKTKTNALSKINSRKITAHPRDYSPFRLMVKAALYVGRAAGERWGRVCGRDCPWHTRSRYTYISPPRYHAAYFPYGGQAFGYYTITLPMNAPSSFDQRESRLARSRADKSPYPGVSLPFPGELVCHYAREVTIKIIIGWILPRAWVFAWFSIINLDHTLAFASEISSRLNWTR